MTLQRYVSCAGFFDVSESAAHKGVQLIIFFSHRVFKTGIASPRKFIFFIMVSEIPTATQTARAAHATTQTPVHTATQTTAPAQEPKRRRERTPEIVLRVKDSDDDEARGEPLPEGATGFREKKKKKEKRIRPTKMSSTIPQLPFGEVRKCLNREP